jgi:signal transduction histidine kinase
VSGRLATASVAREVLERYPWPLVNRVALFVSICAAVAGAIFSENLADPPRVIATAALGAAFVWAYHLLSKGLACMSSAQRAALVALQVACAALLMQWVISNFTGPLLLFLAIGCELQFLLSTRAALAGAGGLALLSLGSLELSLARTMGPEVVLLPQQLLPNAASTLAGFIFVVAFTRSAVTELIQHHQAALLLDELQATHARLQTYVAQVEELTVARERNRLAREIHDTLGHYLTVINVQIETAQKLGARDPERSQAALATSKRLASECLAEVRRSVAALRPAALDGVALPEAIGGLVDDLRRGTGLTVHVESHVAGTLSPAVEVVIYRVVQEALTNVRKHAEAHNVWLWIEWSPALISASVRDDGRGAPSPLLCDEAQAGKQAGSAVDTARPAGYGLLGMRERVTAVGGTLEVETAPGAGFCVTLRVPRPGAARGTAGSSGYAAEAPAR